MGKILSTRKLTIRVIIVVILSLLFMTVFFSWRINRNYLKTSEDLVLSKLYAIAKTGATQVNGNLHRILVGKYSQMNEIADNNQDSIYTILHQQLKQLQVINDIKTPVYTLFPCESSEECFVFFGVTSADEPYYRHPYENFPVQLMKAFDKGGKIPVFRDDHGTWLSAFAPIMDDQGVTVAVLMIDQSFDEFNANARAKLTQNLAIAIGIFILICGLVLFYLRQILQNEEKSKKELEESYAIIKRTNKNVQDSINYAKRIQDALVPNVDLIKEQFPDSYMLFKGKDIVSGDFPWMFSLKDKEQVLIATVDCTGHGVPGALLSIMGHFLLNDIINRSVLKPAEILDELHKGVVKALQQDGNNRTYGDGMDIALLKIDRKDLCVSYAGANRPLYHISKGELKEIRADRLPIGGLRFRKKKQKTSYTNHELKIQPGDSVHFFSDGFADQIGGIEGKRFMSKNLKRLLLDHHTSPMSQVKQSLESAYIDWKGEEKQLDDILMIGIRF